MSSSVLHLIQLSFFLFIRSTTSTPILLQISRSIYLLSLRLESLLKSVPIPGLNQYLEGLEKFIWTSIEHTVDSIRHNVKNTLSTLMKISTGGWYESFLTRVKTLPWSDKKKYVILAAVSRNKGPMALHAAMPYIAEDVLNAFNDLNLTTYSYDLYETFLKCSDKSVKVRVQKEKAF